jgi:cytochrome c peroxidase
MDRRIVSIIGLLLCTGGVLLLYALRGEQREATPIGSPVEIAAPLGLPPIPIPPDNPPTAETIALGRRLYYDPILSIDNSVSCATCHNPDTAFADPKPVSIGVGHKFGVRNSPTVLNSVYYSQQFWDGRAASLEKQAEGPVENPVEMAHSLRGVAERLNARSEYRAEFERAFGPGAIDFVKVEKAIASFERTLVSGNSPFDRWYYGRDQKAVSDSVKRGFEVFRNPKKGNCAVCHTVNEKYALFTDNKFHNIGVGVTEERASDAGRFKETGRPDDMGAFKTPSLRNVAITAPYFHDGSRKTLKEALDYYIGGGNSNPHLDREMHSLNFLNAQERADLIAFLESLTGEMPANSGPPSETSQSAK